MDEVEDAAAQQAPVDTHMAPAATACVPRRASSKKSGRSFSDPPTNTLVNTTTASLTLRPSPEFKQRQRSRDDHALPATPRPTRRPDLLVRGLTLQLPPPRVSSAEAQPARALSPCNLAPPSPQSDSPSLDTIGTGTGTSTSTAGGSTLYMHSPDLAHSLVTNLPRHSRGLDFSRACTRLHHSTVAESSPDSSPIITQRAINIPDRKMSVSSMGLDSPNVAGPGSFPWALPTAEKSTMSSSVGSVNMLGSDTESTESDEDTSMGADDTEDPMFTTPQVHKLQNPCMPTPFQAPPATPGGNTPWATGGHFSPAQTSLMKTMRRSRLQKPGRRSRKSSSSASGSGYSSVNSPRATSPPPLRSIESAANNGYFSWPNAARSRRESLAIGPDGFQLSSGNDSGDEASRDPSNPSTPGVVRRVVTRRGNLLPKTKGFARIRAALLEEAAPVDTENRKEHETMRQVRERDTSVVDLELERPTTATAASSPNLLPAVPECAQEDFGRDESINADSRGLGMNFATHASRNSRGVNYWNRFDPAMRTPPPLNFARQSSSAMSDINMDSPTGDQWRRPRARSSASDASEAFVPTGPQNGATTAVSDDMHLQHFKKRRREDDFDIMTIKRRAVSPGISAQNSPVLTNSPTAKTTNGDGIWGLPPDKKDRKDPIPSDGSLSGACTPQLQPVRSGGSSIGTLASQGKKLGLQPMADTNDGLMKMSIE